MQKGKLYSLSEFNKAIRESPNEFKPKLGKNVESNDKKNNKEAVGDILRQVKRYDRSIKDENQYISQKEYGSEDMNKTTLDYDFTVDPSDEYKDRVRSQVRGYASVAHEDTSDDSGNEGNKRFYDWQKKKNKIQTDKKRDDKAAGLKARMLDKEAFKSKTLYKNESAVKKMPVVRFKRTIFTNEEDMLRKVPDSLKTDGNQFIMSDASGMNYVVECQIDESLNLPNLKVSRKGNPRKDREEIKRMMRLSEYSSRDYFASRSPMDMEAENRNVYTMAESIRKISGKKDVEKNTVMGWE